MVQVAYSIGIAQPLSIHVDSYGTVAKGTFLFIQDILMKIFKELFIATLTYVLAC